MMTKTLLGSLTTIVCAITLAVGAAPAFTAGDGTIVGTVSVPAAACIQLSTTTLNFGTSPFAANGSSTYGVSGDFGVTNCSTAASTFLISGTNAAGPQGADWALTDNWESCDGSLNKYGLVWAEMPESFSGLSITTTPKTLLHHSPGATVKSTFDASESETLRGVAIMPCTGSDGAGQTRTFSIGLTATVA